LTSGSVATQRVHVDRTGSDFRSRARKGDDGRQSRDLAQITHETLIAVARSAGVVIVFLLAFYALKAGSRRVIARVRGRLSPRQMAERSRCSSSGSSCTCLRSST